MITRQDCLLVLHDLKKQGIDIEDAIKHVQHIDKVDIAILGFINNHRMLDLAQFYEKIRKSYNNKKSTLYKNIMQEVDEVLDVINTLNSYALQVTLFLKNVEDKKLFMKHARLNEIYLSLYNYIKTFNLVPCIDLLNLIKADIKIMESSYRDLD